MSNAIAAVVLILAIPLMKHMARGFIDIPLCGSRKDIIWVASALLLAVSASQDGLLQMTGFDPRKAVLFILLCGLGLILGGRSAGQLRGRF